MKITPNYKLRACFESGMQIVGDNSRGILEWLGTDKQRQNADTRIQDHIDLKKAEERDRSYENQVN